MSKTTPKLPDGLTMQQLKDWWTEAYTVYGPAFQRARVLDATDRGKLWKAIAAKFPSYQVLPDTNHVAYIKTNLLASLYSVGRSAHLLPTSADDMETVQHLNIVLDHIWDTQRVSFYQMQAGERAALMNIGITQVGWDNSMIKGTEDTFSKGNVTFDNVDPLTFMRDPYASSLETSAYCIRWYEFHKNVILRDAKYKDAFQKFLDAKATADMQQTTQTMKDKADTPTNKDYHRITMFWVIWGGKLYEIHLVGTEHLLYIKEDVKPAMHPFAINYCNLPAGDLLGTSEPNKIFASSVAYNLMNSIILTAEVKNQKPPRFVNGQSQINLRDFVQHGADSDYTFVVQGDATKAVHYHEFPKASPYIPGLLSGLMQDMQMVTGVDGRYTGKDTGSILTTGGVEQMLDQATLVDQPKIVNYEEYTCQLTKLVLGNLRAYGGSRSYFLKDPKTRTHKTIEVDFPQLKDDTVFHYGINISAHLPKNKQRIAQVANVIMEKQMQYAGSGEQPVSLLTPEEWLMLQDLPIQEMMLDRMGLEREKDYVDKTAKIIFQYADLVDQGMNPDDALLATADSIRTGQPVAPPPQDPMFGQMPPGGAQQPAPPQDMLPPMNF